MKRIALATAISIVNFYLLPFVALNILESDFGKSVLVLLLLVLSPLFSLVGGVIFAKRSVLDWAFPLIVAGLFVPSIYIYYNSTALVYSLVYFTLAAIGVVIGKISKRRQNQ